MPLLVEHQALGPNTTREIPIAPNVPVAPHGEVRSVSGASNHETRAREAKEGIVEVTVYILRCSDGSYYTGLTKRDVEERVSEHNLGLIEGYTSKRRPVQLVFTETYERIVDAIDRERQIKGWSRSKKEALIRYDYEALPDLAKRQR